MSNEHDRGKSGPYKRPRDKDLTILRRKERALSKVTAEA
jgi:hypothetical protein